MARDKVKISLNKKRYYLKNRNKILRQRKIYALRNRKKIIKYLQKYRLKNKDVIKQKKQISYLKNSKIIIKNVKTYYKNNTKICNNRKNKYNINRRKIDINFRIKHNLRTRISKFVTNKLKSKSTMKLLGCSVQELKKHLEKQFKPGMTWLNYGKNGWVIDHIKPCASFDLTNSKEQEKCFNYRNLQPLWALDNLIKGSKY